MGARGLKGSPRSFALAGLLAGARHPVAQRRPARPRGAGRRVPVGSVRRLAGRGTPARGIPWSAAIACVALFVAGHGAVVGAPAGGLRLHLAVDRVGQGPVHPRHRRVEQHHDPRHPRAPAGHGARAAAGDPRRRPRHGRRSSSASWSAASSSCRSWSSGRGDVAARVDFGPFFLYAASCSPSPRWSARSTSRAARSSTRAVALGAARLHPGPRGDRPRGRLGRRASTGLGRRQRATRLFSGAAIGVLARHRAVGGALFVHGVWAGSRSRPSRRSPRRSTPAGAAVDDRVMSIDASGTRYWTGRGGVVLVNDPHRDHRVGRARVRHRLAGAGSIGGQRRRRSDADCSDRRLVPGRGVGDARPARPVRPTPPDRLPAGVRLVTRREAWSPPWSSSSSRSRCASFIAPQIVFPKPEDTAYYVGVARNLLEGRGLVSDAMWCYATEPLVFPKPAFEVWLPLPTFIAVVPMAILGMTYARRPDPVRDHRGARAGPRLAPGRGRRAGARPVARSPARGRPGHRADLCRLPPPRPLLRPDRLDDGLRGPGPRRLPAHGPGRARPARRALDATRGCIGTGRAAGSRRADPQRGGLAGPRSGSASPGPPPGTTRARARPARPRSWPSRPWSSSRRGPCATRLVFGSPLPGQAVTNALSVTGYDIFAWNDPPTLSRYLACRVRRADRDAGRGPLAQPVHRPAAARDPDRRWSASSPCRGRAATAPRARSSCWRSSTFLVTSLVFPVATTWGTFLHAAVPAHVVLVLSAILGLDAGLARLGARLGWTRPVAWLAALLGVFSGLLFSLVLLPSFGDGSRDDAGATTTSWAAAGGRRRAARAGARTRSSATSRSGSRKPAASAPSACPTSHPPTSWTWPARSVPACSS